MSDGLGACARARSISRCLRQLARRCVRATAAVLHFVPPRRWVSGVWNGRVRVRCTIGECVLAGLGQNCRGFQVQILARQPIPIFPTRSMCVERQRRGLGLRSKNSRHRNATSSLSGPTWHLCRSLGRLMSKAAEKRKLPDRDPDPRRRPARVRGRAPRQHGIERSMGSAQGTPHRALRAELLCWSGCATNGMARTSTARIHCRPISTRHTVARSRCVHATWGSSARSWSRVCRRSRTTPSSSSSSGCSSGRAERVSRTAPRSLP